MNTQNDKDVTNNNIQTELDAAYRAHPDCICSQCGKRYIEHPLAQEEHLLDFNDEPYLNRLCNGDLVKL